MSCARISALVIASLRGVDEELDDGLSIACTVVGERLNVPVGIVQQPGGDGQNHVASDAAGEQERGR